MYSKGFHTIILSILNLTTGKLNRLEDDTQLTRSNSFFKSYIYIYYKVQRKRKETENLQKKPQCPLYPLWN